MPSFKTAGKSKEDLAVVAQISGLLNAEETAGMTRAQLVKTIKAANDLAENTDDSALSRSTTEKNNNDEQAMSDKEPQETTAGKTRRTASKRAASATQTATKRKTTRGRKKTNSAASENTDQAKDNLQQAEDSSGQMTENEEAPKKTTRKTSGRTRKSSASSASKTSGRKTTARKTKSAPADTGQAASDQKSESDHQTAVEESAADSSDTKAAGTRKRTTAKKDTAARTRKTAQSKTAENDSEKQTPADKKAAPVSKRRSSAAKRKTAAKKETADEKDTGTPVKAPQDVSVDQVKADSQKMSGSAADENKSSAQAQLGHDQADEAKKEAVNVQNEASNSTSASDNAGQTDDKNQAEKVLARKAEEKQQVIKFMPKKAPANEKPGKKQIPSDDASPEAASAAADQEQDNRASKTDRKDFAEPAKNTHDKGRYNTRQQNRPETRTETKSEQKTETRQQAADIEQVKGKRPHVEAGEVQSGVLEIMPDGYGFLRRDNYLQGSKDIYVPPQYIRRFSLRQGDFVVGPVKLQRESDRYQALLYIKEVNGLPPEKMQRRPNFDKLTPIYPDERLVLESNRNELSTRIIDLVAPIGKGQRGMIVSPPKAGKTILLQKIANAISLNNPEAKLIVLLIDERPEEVTDMQRTINGEVVYSTFDKTPENHTRVVELVLERAMRLVELDQDVVILLDSMTRLARAYNLTINPTGRTLSGGLDPGALYGPKRFFGAARNIENGGSLTIISTSLIETGSRMDEVIFEEFKGTGNMEVYLDRKLSEKRIFPAIDINKSGTRREELLLKERELDAVWKIRKAFSQLDTAAVTEAIMGLLLKTQNNEHFTASINVTFSDKNMYDSMRGNKGGQNGQQGGNGQYNKTSYTSR